MRTAFIETLTENALQRPDIMLVVGDLGFGVVERFSEKCKRQFLNPGVAEQNMTGIAAGLALSGKNVFTYSIANFPTLRPYEQVRNDICYHNANVTIVSVGGGFCYGALGPTHFALEDLAVMRALPGMVVVAPGDPWEARAATDLLVDRHGPAYLRLGRAGEPQVHDGPVNLVLGKAITVRDGSDITILAIGGLLYQAQCAAEELRMRGIDVRLLSMGSLKPIDEPAIIKAVQETKHIFTLEEHSLIGGLGSAVAEVVVDNNLSATVTRIGVCSEFSNTVGSRDWFLQKYGLDTPGIVRTILNNI